MSSRIHSEFKGSPGYIEKSFLIRQTNKLNNRKRKKKEKGRGRRKGGEKRGRADGRKGTRHTFVVRAIWEAEAGGCCHR